MALSPGFMESYLRYAKTWELEQHLVKWQLEEDESSRNQYVGVLYPVIWYPITMGWTRVSGASAVTFISETTRCRNLAFLGCYHCGVRHLISRRKHRNRCSTSYENISGGGTWCFVWASRSISEDYSTISVCGRMACTIPLKSQGEGALVNHRVAMCKVDRRRLWQRLMWNRWSGELELSSDVLDIEHRSRQQSCDGYSVIRCLYFIIIFDIVIYYILKL